jgi:hypothetical protein
MKHPDPAARRGRLAPAFPDSLACRIGYRPSRFITGFHVLRISNLRPRDADASRNMRQHRRLLPDITLPAGRPGT